MKKASLQIAVLALILLAVCAVCRVAMRGGYTAAIPIGVQNVRAEELRFVDETPGVIDRGAPRVEGGFIRVPIYPVRAGETYVDVIGAIVCGLKAARHNPAPGADCILILGCKFRRDGTLTPLLRGRVDRAIDYWKRQREATGREAVLMPSGALSVALG